MTQAPAEGSSLHTRILLALVFGAACGVAVNLLWPQSEIVEWILHYVMRPIGEIFLRLLFLTVVPLVFTSLALGVARFGDLGSLGRIGGKTFAFFLITMTVAVALGLFLVNTIQPGAALPKEVSERLLKEYSSVAKEKIAQPTAFGLDTFLNIVPRNPLQALVQMDMLATIFFALIFGIGLTRISPERATYLMEVLQGIGDIMVIIIHFAMKIAPFGVFALIFTVTARFGFDLLKPLGLYVLVVLGGLAVQMFGVLSLLVAALSRLAPWDFFPRVTNVIITAFSTSSSSATLPTSIRTAQEELGVPAHIAGFVLPMGATMNMNGTALYEGVTVLFLAQVFGVPLGLGEQLIVTVLAVLTAVGAAGVPGGSLPLLVMVLATVGVPEMGIALVLGVDRLLDMCRTTLNVIGDLAAATYVARSEGYTLLGARD